MRRILVIGLAALVPAFFSAAGRSHVHRSAHPHPDARALHHDHRHLGHSDDGSHAAVERLSPAVDHGHSDPHDGDAIYVSDPPNRAGTRTDVPLPPIEGFRLEIDPRSSASDFSRTHASRPRDPPDGSPPGLRAPPA